MSGEQGEARDTATVLVLIAEDERSIAGFVAETVADAGYVPVVAANGREALERAQEQWPALVVTDLMMPQLDGAGLIQALRGLAAQSGGAMPPVILTTAASPSYAHEAGADAVLRKPFNLDDLEALLRRFLG